MPNTEFLIISDGACSKNPGPGGWGTILVTPDKIVQEFGGHEDQTTNNRMELMGFYRGLQEIYKRRSQFSNTKSIRAISDSKYVLDGTKIYLPNWEKNSWKTSTGSEVKNQDLWVKVSKGKKLLHEAGLRVIYELVKGHSGHSGNERVDVIAVKYTHEDPVELYHGPLSAYGIDLEKIDKFETCYLSYVSGKLQRHQTWNECRAAVEGKPGAKYKKVSHAVEERETLAGWGLKR